MAAASGPEGSGRRRRRPGPSRGVAVTGAAAAGRRRRARPEASATAGRNGGRDSGTRGRRGERASAARPESPRLGTCSGGGQARVRTGKRPDSSRAGRRPGGAGQARSGWAEWPGRCLASCGHPAGRPAALALRPRPARVALVPWGRFKPPDACSAGAPGSSAPSGFPVPGVRVPRSHCCAGAGVTVVFSGRSFGDRAGVGGGGAGKDADEVAPTEPNSRRPPVLASRPGPGAAASAGPRPRGSALPNPGGNWAPGQAAGSQGPFARGPRVSAPKVCCDPQALSFCHPCSVV